MNTPGRPTFVLLSGARGDTRRYRTIHLYEQIRLAGGECILTHLTFPRLSPLLAQADVVVFHRAPLDSYVADLLAGVQQRNALVLLDMDDLLFDPSAIQWIDSPDFQDPLRVTLYKEEMQRHRGMLEACQAVLASTDFLASQAHQRGKQAWVHRNAFSLEMLSISEAAYQNRQANPNKIIMGYASGTATHNRDFAMIRPALETILQRYPTVELWLVGPLDAGSDWQRLQGRIKRMPFVPWRELPTLQAQFDINLAPLVLGNPFAQSKSEIKYMEAGLLRVPTIASASNAFQYAIQHGENGMLAGTDQGWVECLSTLIEQPGLRREMAERAYADTLKRYHPRQRSAELVMLLNQVSERLASRHLWDDQDVSTALQGASLQQPLTGPEMEQQPTLISMGVYSLRRRGWNTLARQAWVFVRRWLSRWLPYPKRGDA